MRYCIEKLSNRSFLALTLATVTLLLYLPVRHFGFVNYDDPRYVSENPFVRMGVTRESIHWAFTSFHASNWHPLTWLSHMLDCQFFGLNAGQHHINNVILHMINSMMIFLNLNSMTGKIVNSFVVALLFSLHPVHVESVAWISERKDLLSTFFVLISLRYYILYINEKKNKDYLLLLLFYAFGLMAKPMIVTFPFILLLLDYWPLCRCRKMSLLTLEKLPMFFLSAGSSIVTFIAQRSGGAVVSLEEITLYHRIMNSFISYLMYLFHIIFPLNLCVFYPQRENPSFWIIGCAFLFITIFTVLSIRCYEKFPYVLTGWLWYLGTLVPVIGLVQVGLQSMADRYTYIPSVGIFIIVTWFLLEQASALKLNPKYLFSIFGIILSCLIYLSHRQIFFWKDSFILYGRVLKYYENNHIFHFFMAGSYYDEKKYEKALFHYRRSIELVPTHANAYRYIGDIYSNLKQFDQADDYYSRALLINPDNVDVYISRGNSFMARGNAAESIPLYEKAIHINSKSFDAMNNIGLAMLCIGRIDESISFFEKAYRNSPHRSQFKNNYYMANSINAKIVSVTSKFKTLLSQLSEKSPDSKKIAVELFLHKSRMNRLFKEYEMALKFHPGFSLKSSNDIRPIAEVKREYERRLPVFIEMDKLFPHTPEIEFHIACIKAIKGEFELAHEWLLNAFKDGFSDISLAERESDFKDFRESDHYVKFKESVKNIL